MNFLTIEKQNRPTHDKKLQARKGAMFPIERQDMPRQVEPDISHHDCNILKSALASIPILIFCLVLSAYWVSVSNSKTFLIPALLVPIAVYAICIIYKSGSLSSSKLCFRFYAIALSASLLIYTIVFPPITIPDELHHYEVSYAIADHILGKADSDSYSLRNEDLELINNSKPELSKDSYKEVLSNFSLFEKDPSQARRAFSLNLGSENLTARFGSVAGIILGRVLHLGAYPTYYLGRILNAAFFAICALISYKLAPIGKNVFAVVSLLPMTLHVAASYSYDAGIIGLSMIASSALLYAIYTTGKLSNAMQIIIAISLIMLAPCKIVYSSIAMLIFFIPSGRFESNRRAQLFKVGIIIGMCAFILLIRTASVSTLIDGTNLDYRGAESGHFYTVTDILNRPLSFFAMFMRTFEVLGDQFLSTFLGGSLGWFQPTIAAPLFLMLPFFAILILAAQPNDLDSITIDSRIKTTMLATAAISWLGVMASMLIGWTFNTETIILGVQGRYFLPVAPLFILGLRSQRIKLSGDPTSLIIILMVCMNLMYSLRIVAHAFAI